MLMKPSTLLLIAGLSIALAAVVWWDWTAFGATGFAMPAIGWIALGVGALVTIAVGSGLMFLVFYSSRHGYDDAAGSADGDPGARPGKTQD